MALLAFGCNGLGFDRSRAIGLLLCLLAMLAPRPGCAADVTVIMDQAALIRLPDMVATIVIGNPMIADASLQPGGLMVITGKGYGLTNFLVLDRAGAVLMEKTIEVQGPDADVVVMYRGIERETYSCTPVCERRITLGDGNVYFETGIAQSGGRNGQAQGVPAPAK
jgi:Pilus formation protein N terminal region